MHGPLLLSDPLLPTDNKGLLRRTGTHDPVLVGASVWLTCQGPGLLSRESPASLLANRAPLSPRPGCPTRNVCAIGEAGILGKEGKDQPCRMSSGQHLVEEAPGQAACQGHAPCTVRSHSTLFHWLQTHLHELGLPLGSAVHVLWRGCQVSISSR